MQTEESAAAGAIRANLDKVRAQIEAAAQKSGRTAEDIQIVAVTKGHPASAVRAAWAAGLNQFGENYLQEARAKQADLSDLAQVRWHFIGHLQRNKAADAAQAFGLIQSVDSERLARALAQAAERLGTVRDVLVQARLGEEPTKTGVDMADAPALCEGISRMPGLRLLGLMGIAPRGVDPRPHFAALRKLFDCLPRENRRVLSMGMSADFEDAIAEGATLVRIGQALLGRRSAISR